MSNCKNCGYETNGSAFCPQCGTKIDQMENTQMSGENQQVYAEVEQTMVNEQPVVQQQFNYEQPVQTIPPKQPSAFSRAFKQAINCFKYFFSKNAVEAISVQHSERLNVWIILFAVPALLSAISCCIHGVSFATEILSIINMPYNLGANRFAWFVSGLLLMGALEFSFVIATFMFTKFYKKQPISFVGCANLISACFIPITLLSSLMVITGDNTGVLGVIAILMFVYFWEKGLNNAFGEKEQHYLTFLIVVAVCLVTYSLASAIVSAPGWIFNGINSFNAPGVDDIINPYLW